MPSMSCGCSNWMACSPASSNWSRLLWRIWEETSTQSGRAAMICSMLGSSTVPQSTVPEEEMPAGASEHSAVIMLATPMSSSACARSAERTAKLCGLEEIR